MNNRLAQILNKPNPRILISRFDRIGDVMLTTPVFQALKIRYPNAHVGVFIQEKNRELVEGNPNIDEIIGYDKEKANSGFWKTVQFAKELKKKKFDLVVHLHPTNRIHLIGFLAGIPFRIGYQKKWGFLNQLCIPEQKYKGEKHEAEYNFDLLELINVSEISPLLPAIYVNERDRALFGKVLNQAGIYLSESYYVIHPGSSCPSKKWPIERYVELANSIYEKYHLEPVLIGDELTLTLAESFERDFKGSATNLVGKLGLKQLAVLFEK